MFFRQVRRNAAKNRRGSGLYFGTLVIAIIASYTLLSLGEQDVMRFLAAIESDAVRKLMMLLPVVYVLALFFLFFLVYFACKYQMDSRRKEIGMYRMLGMGGFRLFSMLLCETVWNSLISLLVGLPAAVLLTEVISLAVARMVGLGILSHRFSLDVQAMLWTIGGFLGVQMASMAVVCLPLCKAEPASLFRSDAPKRQRSLSGTGSGARMAVGICLLLAAYYLGLVYLGYLDYRVVLILVFGIAGTFCFYRGLGGFLGRRLRRKSGNQPGLSVFTARQIQEQVCNQYQSLAVCSLLLLLALSCISYGIGMGLSRGSEERTTDLSLQGSQEAVEAVLSDPVIRERTQDAYPVYLSFTRSSFGTDGLSAALSQVPGGESVNDSLHLDYVLSLSSYNRLLEAMGKPPLELSDGTVALYSSMDDNDFYGVLDEALSSGVQLTIEGKAYDVRSGLCHEVIAADRAITLYLAVIVPDNLYPALAVYPEPFCWNLHLNEQAVAKQGLLQALMEMETLLEPTGIEYSSYLGGIGRNLFYTVGTCYLTIYLGILFLLIANTALALKYLIQQRQNRQRYITLQMLGATPEALCKSAGHQIFAYFALVLSLSVVSSAIAVCALFGNVTRLPAGASLGKAVVLGGIALAAFAIIEVVYLTIVRRGAFREIQALDVTHRGQ